jgi:hypothetical protein
LISFPQRLVSDQGFGRAGTRCLEDTGVTWRGRREMPVEPDIRSLFAYVAAPIAPADN